MKAERRHELQTNELATILTHGYEKNRQHLPTVLWAAVAVLAVIMAVSVWSSRRGNSQLHVWEEFDQIRYAEAKARPKKLKELADRYQNHEVALWAYLDLADQLCFDGREKMPIDREIATTYLKEAQQNYAFVLQHQNARPEMIRRAAIAEAKCWELLGDREKAIATYQAAADKYKTRLPDVAASAAQHAAELSQPEAADFYKWLAEYKPPTSPSLNFPGLGPTFPPLNDDKEDKKESSAAPQESSEAQKPDSQTTGDAESKAGSDDASKKNTDSSSESTESTKPD